MKFLVFLFVIILLAHESLAESEEDDDCHMRAFKMAIQFVLDVPDNMTSLLYQKTGFDPEDSKFKCKSLDQFNANVKSAIQTLADCPDYHLYYKIRSLSMSFVCSLDETNAKYFYKPTDNKLQKTCVVNFQGHCTDLGLNFCNSKKIPSIIECIGNNLDESCSDDKELLILLINFFQKFKYCHENDVLNDLIEKYAKIQ